MGNGTTIMSLGRCERKRLWPI